MAKNKVYAVRKGKKTGLFYSWPKCQAAVSGFPGAEFRGFPTEEEANAYLEDSRSKNVKATEEMKTCLVAYVDGSYDEKIGRYSFGCVILTPEGDTVKKSGNGDNPESLAIRNVAGEMLGAMSAAKWAVENGYTDLILRYDYEGIEKWVTGAWRAKNTLTQKYAEYMKNIQKLVYIQFEKVKAHTGDYYNEEADKLAKKALKDENP